MPRLEFGPWLPDNTDIGGQPHLVDAQGCLPAVDHYRPLPGLSVTTDALTARCRGVFPARDADNAVHMFAADNDDLYKLVSGSWTNYSRVAGYTPATSTTRWRGTTYGDRLILVNGLDEPQYIDMSTAATEFADLPGSPPAAKFVAAYGEFVFLGAIATSGLSIKWSGIGNSEQWTAGSNQSDEQEFADGGNITGFVATKAALYVFQNNCIRRVLYVGGDVIMRIDKLVDGIGCIEPNSLINWGNICFFLSEAGWYLWDFESQPVPFAAEKFDRWFLDDSSREYWPQMSTVIDPKNRVFACGYGTSSDTPNTILFYDYVIGRATYARISHEILVPALAVSSSLDDLTGDLDADYSISFDDPYYQGGAFYFAAMNTDHKLASFAGSNVEATFETNEAMMFDGRRASIAWIKPVCDASGATAAAGSKVKPSDAIAFQSAVSQQASGRCPQRGANGFYHAAKIVIPSGQTWTYANGFEFEPSAARGVR
jgi:hypothetical protein